ncbi:MAG: helix-turn-helix transcriptional regulator [Planctomycetota bacterium]|jgi:prophage regulatory protein
MQDKKPRLIRFPEVIRRTSISRSQIYVLMGDGKFPQSIKLGPLSIAWPEHEIDAWLEERIASRQKSKAA